MFKSKTEIIRHISIITIPLAGLVQGEHIHEHQ
jgi:hypothetical protein